VLTTTASVPSTDKLHTDVHKYQNNQLVPLTATDKLYTDVCKYQHNPLLCGVLFSPSMLRVWSACQAGSPKLLTYRHFPSSFTASNPLARGASALGPGLLHSKP
jgi:hypothetical protein